MWVGLSVASVCLFVCLSVCPRSKTAWAITIKVGWHNIVHGRTSACTHPEVKDRRSNPNPNRPAWVCMSIRMHISLVCCCFVSLNTRLQAIGFFAIYPHLIFDRLVNKTVVQVWFQNRRSKERRMKQLNVVGARRQFYRSGVSATRRLRELMPADELRLSSADSLRSSADFIAHQHNFAFCVPGEIIMLVLPGPALRFVHTWCGAVSCGILRRVAAYRKTSHRNTTDRIWCGRTFRQSAVRSNPIK